MVISILYYIMVSIVAVVFFFIALLIWILTVGFDRRLVLQHKFTSMWSSLYLMLMPSWRIKVLGREKCDPKKTYVIVSNHQSQLDILVSFRLGRHFKFVSKAEVFRIPFIGWNMSLNRYISIKRGKSGSIKRMFEDCEKNLQHGNSVFMFPEGTRSRTGVPRAFKGGAFALAKRAQVPVLIVVINGTTDALPKSSIFFGGVHHISLEVIGEMSYEEIAELDSDEIAEMARLRIVEALPAIKPVESVDSDEAHDPQAGEG
ncbi:MAG: 1-acyl-sn-glycerol-3-phosphate acyltransferase [Planctomycetes bacterium]|nr:1-acyl-sn-glycerol-3-phosphate acyltransferase [Planctomycetota bacterium]